MGSAISMDLRQRIMAMITTGSSCRAAARHFCVGESTAIRLKRRYLADGTMEPKRDSRFGRGKPAPLRDCIPGVVKERPDLTLIQISARIFEKKGIKVTVFCLDFSQPREDGS